MIIAICSSGPSLERTLAAYPLQADLVITVNRAANYVGADWICAGDLVMCQQLAERWTPRHGICAIDGTIDMIEQGACRPWTVTGGLLLRRWSELPGHGHTWCRPNHAEGFTFTSAIALAMSLGATALHIYGRDCTDGPDCSGLTDSNRSEDRWRRESDELASLGAHRLDTTIFHAGRAISTVLVLHPQQPDLSHAS